MDETELQGLVEVSDPNVLRLLEKPQEAIDKETGVVGDGASGKAGAYSQSALDAFDRAINTGKGLLTDPGLPAAVGSGFDPASWGSYNPRTGKPFAGTKAADFEANLSAMKAQVFLPMVQSMKGMGALSNAEGEKLTAAIGALDTNMSEEAFKTSLQRIIGDLQTYKQRGMNPDGQSAGAALGKPAPGDIQFGGGNDEPPPGWAEFQADLQKELSEGRLTSADQIMGYAHARGFTIDAEQANAAARAVAKGAPVLVNPPTGLSAADQDLVDQRVGETGAGGAVLGGVMDTLTMGAADKIGAGVDAFAGAMRGDGSFGELYGRNAAVNDAYLEGVQDEHPWAYGSGQIAGGLALPMFGARSPAQLAKVAAAYGGAYGAGSSDSLAEIPGNAATGAALGGAAGWAGGKLADRIGAAVESRAAARLAEETPPAAKEAGENAASRYARGQQFGVDLNLGDVGGMSAKAGERVLDYQPGSAGIMNKSRERLGGQMLDAADSVAGKYGPSTGFAGIGEAAQKGARQWISKFEEASGKAYDAIPISPKAPARLDNTRQALSELTTIFESNPKMAETFANARLNRYMTALADGEGGLSWDDLKAFRSRIGEEIGEQRFSESPTKTELRRLYGALSEDMKATARKIGPGAERAFERANTLYRQGQQRIDEALTKILGDDGKMSPEKAAARIQTIVKDGRATTDLAAIHELWKSLPAGERGEVANGLIRLLGQPLNKAERDFSPQTFVKNFTDMTPASKNLIFGASGKDLRSNLDEFAKLAGDVAANNSTRNTSNTAMGLAGLFGFGAGGPMGLITQTVGSYGTARLWTSPKFVRWATGYTKMLKGAAKAGADPTAAGVRTHIKLLEKLASSEPALAQDILPIKDAMLRAANDNAGRAGSAAASPDERPEKDGKPD